MNQKNLRKISIVIPSIAGISLTSTVDCILSSNIEGFELEIIVVVPSRLESQAIGLLDGCDVKIIGANKSGQVFQRSIGFKMATGEIVLQLDDDMSFDKNLIRNLLQILINMGPGNVVAPLIKDQLSGLCGERIYTNGLIRTYKNLIDFLIYGLPWGKKKYGSYSFYCGARTVNVSNLINNLNEVQWLPGGIVMCFREDLVFEDFYPLKGKAFAEDLIHSQIRKANGLKHWIVKDLMTIHCSTYVAGKKNYKDEMSSLFHDLKKYVWISKRLGGSEPRIWIGVIYQFFSGILFIARKNIKEH